MHPVCPECGATVAQTATCRDNFSALLALEWEVPQGAGTLAHFFAVSAYILQHPDTMNYTSNSLDWLRSAVKAALDGEATVLDLRARADAETGNVIRRHGDAVPSWNRSSWTMTVDTVVSAGPAGYGDRVRLWAETVLADIDAAPSVAGRR